jgi:hypothetical protein
MKLPRHLSAFLALLLTAGAVAAQAQTPGQDSGWVSYRDAYRAMVVFDKYGKPKSLIQNHVQVMPRQKDVGVDGVQLALKGRTVNVSLPLDPTGRAVFPLLKAAYDENAVLVLNREPGQYAFRRRVSIAPRPDGIYDSAELRAACEQALDFERHVNGAAARLKCVGVRFAFAAKSEPAVRLRKGEGAAVALPAVDGAAFSDDPNAAFRVVNYRFGEAGQVLTQGVPVAIAPLFE